MRQSGRIGRAVRVHSASGLGSRDVGSEEVDAVSVEVAPGSVVVLGGAWVDMANKDLGVAVGDARVESVGDRGVPQRVWADGPS